MSGGRARPRKVVAALVALAALAVSSCDGSRDEDDRRVAKISGYEIVRTAPPSSVAVDPPSADEATSSIPWETGGGAHHAGSGWETTTLSFAETGRFYVAALARQGWQDIHARCRTAADGWRSVTVVASRWEGKYATAAVVDLQPAKPRGVRIHISVAAPFHDEDGRRPHGDPPNDACLAALDG